MVFGAEKKLFELTVGKKDKKDKVKKLQKLMAINMDRTLTELEKSDWGEPEYQTSLVINCHRIRKIPLRYFTAEDCRVLIGQRISLPYVIPVAIQLLERNALADGGYYAGDLLFKLLTTDRTFGRRTPPLGETCWAFTRSRTSDPFGKQKTPGRLLS
ncbi:MAG: hypothetical protein IPN95_18125 [Bacteroidetes bacterium]|nr:hypothetical protein [Bacteroidota bacterium]